MRKSRRVRIAYGRISQETNAFSPVGTTFDDFRRQHLLEGRALERACSLLGNEAPGWTPAAELTGFLAAARRRFRSVEPVPLFSAWALPSGPLTEETVRDLRGKLAETLRAAGRVDGVYLAMHGAMRARGEDPEPEAGFLATVRETLGRQVPVAVTLDLHANLTPALVKAADILVAYRTNPHRDLPVAGYRAGRLLIRTVQGEIRPVSAWRTLPMVMGGGRTVDFLPPMRSIYRRLAGMEREPRVLGASLCMCHLWNDSPDLGWSTHVMSDADPDLAETLAEELAERAWAVRHEPPPPFLSPAEVLEAVRRSRLRRLPGTFCLCDASDVVGAGATGENTNLVRVLLERGRGLRGYAPILDAGAVAELWDRAAGSRAEVTVGGTLDPETNPPLTVAGRLRARTRMPVIGRAVALDLGDLQLVVTENPPFNLKPSFFSDLGLDPWRADYVVVKSLFHFRLFYLALNRKSFLVRTRGITDLDIARGVRFRHPVVPFSEVRDWRETDRARRGP